MRVLHRYSHAGLARRLLVEEFGIECPWPPRRKDRRGEVAGICDRECVLKRDCWELWIWRRDSLLRFAALINFRVERKRGEAGGRRRDLEEVQERQGED